MHDSVVKGEGEKKTTAAQTVGSQPDSKKDRQAWRGEEGGKSGQVQSTSIQWSGS